MLLFIAMFISPWWLLFATSILCAFAFRKFYEIIFIGFFFDLMYTNSSSFLHSHFFLFYALITFVIIQILQKRLTFYTRMR